MSELIYSGDAMGTLNRFHRCDAIVYVEGDDDELFWETVFENCSSMRVKTEGVGGAPELDKMIVRIIEEDLPVLAARDSDFIKCCGKEVKDPRILYTYGYSIENTLYLESTLGELCRLWCKGKFREMDQRVMNWFSHLEGTLKQAIEHDVINEKYQLGLSVIGDNIAKFSDNSVRFEIDSKRVDTVLRSCVPHVTANMRLASVRAIRRTKVQSVDLLRGHFLASAVLQYIIGVATECGLTIKITYDGLRVSALQRLQAALRPGHRHFDHYEQSVKDAIAVV